MQKLNLREKLGKEHLDCKKLTLRKSQWSKSTLVNDDVAVTWQMTSADDVELTWQMTSPRADVSR